METKTVPSYQENLKGLITQLTDMLPPEALGTFNSDALQLQQNHANPLKLNVGDMAPNFTLANAVGENISLNELLSKGKVVLVFYRGTWCPYCNLQLNQYQQILVDIKANNANLIAISPQIPDESLNMQEKNVLKFEVLSDIGNEVARQYTTVFRNGDLPIEAMEKLGIQFDDFYGDDTRELPVPAVYIINQNAKVIFAQSEGGDYRNRVEPQAILEALK